MDKVDRLVVARHGEPDLRGRNLSRIGVIETERLARQIIRFLRANLIPGEIGLLTSDANRAIETAEIIAQVLNLPAHLQAWQVGDGRVVGVNVEPTDFAGILKPTSIIVTHGGQILPLIEHLSHAKNLSGFKDPDYGGALAVNPAGRVTVISAQSE